MVLARLSKGVEARSPGGLLEGYAVALFAVIVCTVARLPLQSALDTRAPYAFFMPAVAFCAWRYGLKPALVCLGLGACVGTYMFVTPVSAIMHRPEALSLLIFLGSATTVALMGGAHGQAHADLEVARQALRDANEELEQRVTDRTAALVEKNEALNSFTYTVAHDLRSAIRSMVVNARLLKEDEGERLGPEGCEKTERLYGAAMRLSSFVDDLLQYAREGNKPVERQAVSLSDLFEDEANDVAATEGVSRLDLRIEPGVRADCDPALVSLVFRNLVQNACKYRGVDKLLEIEFGADYTEGELVFFVRDNGIGFDPVFADRIFEPFERLHRYADIPGTGIGLSNVRRAIERHGGKVWAQSKAGAGATFFFTLGGVAAARHAVAA
ncbi:MAG: hypothetical protein QOJ65_1834 [Fimbriimonadaceae bacterium]|jgi:signal transduction histidine kinase|nr:hypothetical protein [Fimbriimonadaceae bacterium]